MPQQQGYNTEWEKILAQLRPSGVDLAKAIRAQKAANDPYYAAGAALGDALNSMGLSPQAWAKNYSERGRMKGELQDKLNGMFGADSKTIQDLKEQGIWDDYHKLADYNKRLDTPPKPQTPEVNPQAGTPNFREQAKEAALPKPNMEEILGDSNKSPLGQAADPAAGLPETNVPFGAEMLSQDFLASLIPEERERIIQQLLRR